MFCSQSGNDLAPTPWTKCFVTLLCYFSDGVVSLNEYMAFMISRETENVRSAKEVEDAFRAITDGGKQPFVTEEELYQVNTLMCHTSYNFLFRNKCWVFILLILKVLESRFTV